jgi:putative oxidoreductase
LQRLFTTFADGWPGLGLLVQRLITGIVLLHFVIMQSQQPATIATIAAPTLEAILAILLMIGLWTPMAGALTATIEVWTAFVSHTDGGTAVLLATLGGTLAMIGPGAFSMDARLFGRKHIRN